MSSLFRIRLLAARGLWPIRLRSRVGGYSTGSEPCSENCTLGIWNIQGNGYGTGRRNVILTGYLSHLTIMVSIIELFILQISYRSQKWWRKQSVAARCMITLYSNDMDHTKWASYHIDGSLQSSFHAILKGWIHTETKVHGCLHAPSCSQSNRSTHSFF